MSYSGPSHKHVRLPLALASQDSATDNCIVGEAVERCLCNYHGEGIRGGTMAAKSRSGG